MIIYMTYKGIDSMNTYEKMLKELGKFKWFIENLYDRIFVRFIIILLIVLPGAFAILFIKSVSAIIVRGVVTDIGVALFALIFMLILVAVTPRAVKYIWHNFIVLDMTMTALRRKYNITLKDRHLGASKPVYFFKPVIDKERKRREQLYKRGVRFQCGRIIKPIHQIV